MKILETTYDWWEKSKKERLRNTTKGTFQRTICSYGKNYFGYFVTNQKTIDESMDDIIFISLYEKFEKRLFEIGGETISQGDFKKDEYSKQLLIEVEIMPQMTELKEVQKNELKELINHLSEDNWGYYSITKTISHYFNSTKSELPYFKVFFSKNNKMNTNVYFPNSTFDEIIDTTHDSENPGLYKSFKESLFYREIQKEFPLFILELDGNPKKVKDIKYIPSVTFANFEKEAEIVYDETIEAFKCGDENLFTKSSDNKNFYIKQMVINAEDSFIFTNGNSITKMTFWANMETVQAIVNQAP